MQNNTSYIKSALAPMAGYTDAPFRRLCSRFGASYVVSEMISALALTLNDRKTARLAAITAGEAPCVLQIFGHDPTRLASAAEILLRGEFDGCEYASPPAGIDINMGCPVKKIVSNGDGSAMMKSPVESAEAVKRVREVCERYGVPLSVKIRLGMTAATINAPEYAAAMVGAGAQRITVHCRTREMMYAPSAMPEYIPQIREAIDSEGGAILCGNGDIECMSDAERYISLGCDEVAVGRGALGNPWLFAELAGKGAQNPTIHEIVDLCKAFVGEVVALRGEEYGIRESRGRAAHFIKGLRGSAAVRDELNHAVTYGGFCEILEKLL